MGVTAKDMGIKCLGKYLINRSGQNVGFYCDPKFSWTATTHLRLVGFISITPCSTEQGTHWYNKGRKKNPIPLTGMFIKTSHLNDSRLYRV